MKIVVGWPPIIDQIKKVFPLATRPGTIFSWGDTIYNPANVALPESIIAHEAVHGARQGNDIAGILAWWDRYLKDPRFRLDEEIPAHVAEYRVLMATATSRQQRRAGVVQIAKRLSGPLYGRMISFDEAKKVIQA